MRKTKKEIIPAQRSATPTKATTSNSSQFIRIKLYISGSSEFAFFDLLKNTKIDYLERIISVMYNYDRSTMQLFYNKDPIRNYFGKTLEQVFSTSENQLILIFDKTKKNSSTSISKNSQSPSVRNIYNTEKIVNKNTSSYVPTLNLNTVESERKQNLTTLRSTSPILKSDRSQGKYSSNSLLDDTAPNAPTIRTSSSIYSTIPGMKKSDYLIKKDLENLKREFSLLEMSYNNLEAASFLQNNLSEKIENDFDKDSTAIADCIREIKEKLDARRNKIVGQMYKSKENSMKSVKEFEGNFEGLVKRIAQLQEDFTLGLKIFNEFYTRLNLTEFENLDHGKIANQIKGLWQISSDLKSQYLKISKETAELNKLRYEHTNEYLNLFNKINTMLTSDIEDLELKPKNSYEIISTIHKEVNIFSIQENSNFVYVYNPTQGVYKKRVNFSNCSEKVKSFFWNSRTIQIKNSLYITGGHDQNNNAVKTVLYYLDNNVTEIKSMNFSHWGHSVSVLLNNYIFVISGYFTKKCEFYDIKKGVWTNLAEINYWRMDSTIFIYNNQFIYVFGGWNNFYKNTVTNINSNNNYVDKIEKLKICSSSENTLILNNNKWEILPLLTSKQSSILPELKKSSMGIISISNDRFLLIGGDTSEYNSQSYDDSNFSGIGASKVIHHNTVVEVKINCYGNCEFEIKKFNLDKTTCFSTNKNFSMLNKSEFGCYNQSNKFCVFSIKEKNHFSYKIMN